MIVNISGMEVQIDKEYLFLIQKYKWCLNKSMVKHRGVYYFLRNTKIGNKRTCVTLHREIMNCTIGDGHVVDHINGDTLDNRRSNLRICNNTENVRNQKLHKCNTSGYRGVSKNKKTGKWIVHISVNNKILHIGTFVDIKDAVKAYENASNYYYKDYGRPSCL